MAIFRNRATKAYHEIGKINAGSAGRFYTPSESAAVGKHSKTIEAHNAKKNKSKPAPAEAHVPSKWGNG